MDAYLSPQSISPETFWLYPSNEVFVTGKSRHVTDGSSTGLMSFLMLGFVLFGIVLFLLGARDSLRWVLLAANSKVVSGVFVDRRIALEDNVNGYYVTIRYQNENGVYQIEQKVDESAYMLAHVGNPVQVRYSLLDSGTAVIEGTNTFPVSFALFALLWNGVVDALAFHVWRRYWLLRKLERTGILLAGNLTRSLVHTHHDSDPVLRVEYCFISPDGLSITGTDSVACHDLKTSALPRAGRPIYILYLDPHHYILL